MVETLALSLFFSQIISLSLLTFYRKMISHTQIGNYNNVHWILCFFPQIVSIFIIYYVYLHLLDWSRQALDLGTKIWVKIVQLMYNWSSINTWFILHRSTSSIDRPSSQSIDQHQKPFSIPYNALSLIFDAWLTTMILKYPIDLHHNITINDNITMWHKNTQNLMVECCLVTSS